MGPAPIVTLIAVALTVVVLAGYLITIALILKRVFGRLEIILGAVSEVTEKTAPAGEVIAAINADLAAGHAALDAAVLRLKERTGSAEDGDGDDDVTSTSGGRSGWWQR